MERKSINNYKCPSCGGGLTFDPSSGKVTCEYCDSTYTVEEIEKIYKPQEESEEDDSPTVDSEGFDQAETQWNTDSLNQEWGADEAKMKEYNCPSCGANMICEESTAATSCPYCGNPTIIETQFAGNLRPDYIIPFKFKKKEAIEALKEFYKGKKLLAKEFSDENHLEEIKGIYVPFWLFDGCAQGSVTFRTTKTTVSRHGNRETTTTRYFDCHRAGKVEFQKIPVDASEKMPDDMMDSLEPFDYGELKEFSTAYLPGYLADKYDVTVEQSSERANTRCSASFISKMQDSVGMLYDSCRLIQKDILLKSGTVHYALLPVYLLYTKWNDQKFLFAVNGQSKRVVGDLPISKKRSVIFFITRFLAGLIIGAVVGVISVFVLKHIDFFD